MTSTSPGTKTLTEALPVKKTMTPTSYRTTTTNLAWYPVYHLLALLCQTTLAIELPFFVYVQSASRNGIVIEMLPAYIARRIQPISSGSQIS
jgi:hypothetical protein